MATINFVSENNLRAFKAKQDAQNLTKFVALDANGKAKAEQLPSYVDDVVDVHVENDTASDTKKFYLDNNGVKGDELLEGEKGKIYIDLDATVDGQYRWSGSHFVAIGNSVSTADKAINDANGDPITATYATKKELETATTSPATTEKLGVVKIGSNIEVSEGTIFITDTSVTSALGYTPLNSADIAPLDNSVIDAMFDND